MTFLCTTRYCGSNFRRGISHVMTFAGIFPSALNEQERSNRLLHGPLFGRSILAKSRPSVRLPWDFEKSAPGLSPESYVWIRWNKTGRPWLAYSSAKPIRIRRTRADKATIWFIWPGLAVINWVSEHVVSPWNSEERVACHLSAIEWDHLACSQFWLTHWPLGDVAVILKVWSPNILSSCLVLLVKLLSCQYWFRLGTWFGTARQQAITCATLPVALLT